MPIPTVNIGSPKFWKQNNRLFTPIAVPRICKHDVFKLHLDNKHLCIEKESIIIYHLPKDDDTHTAFSTLKTNTSSSFDK